MRRTFTVATSVVALSALSAGPALAHYCYKTGWNDAGYAGASRSQAWMTADEWYALIGGLRALNEGNEACDGALDDFAAHVGSYPADTLFMGPGLLAGGAVEKGKSPANGRIGHMDTSLFGPIFGSCSFEPPQEPAP